jgi:hypothetical protein
MDYINSARPYPCLLYPLTPQILTPCRSHSHKSLVFDQSRSFSSMPTNSSSSTSAGPSQAGTALAGSKCVGLTEPLPKARSMVGQTGSSGESGLKFEHNCTAAHPAASCDPDIWAWAEKRPAPGNSLAVETPTCTVGQANFSSESGLGFKHDCIAAHLAALGEIPGQSTLQPPTSQIPRGMSQPKPPPHHASPNSDTADSCHPEAWEWVGERSAPGNSAGHVPPASSTSRLSGNENSDDEGSSTESKRNKSHLVSGQQSRMTLAESPERPIG